MTTAQEDQYVAATREAEQIVRADPHGFALNEPGRPEVIAQWAFRFAIELNENVTRKCPHGSWSQVHTVFGCEPNLARCNIKCAEKRHKELRRDARQRRTRECDFCHQQTNVVEVCFAVAAVVVRPYICAMCMLAPSVAGRV